jgi:glycosyltransferase involved in cell wall biosynthesis
MSAKKLLIVSKHFPPNGQPGSHRLVGFIKYLTKLDWKIFVLTLKPEFSFEKHASDESLLGKIPSCTSVHQTGALRLLWPLSGLNSYLVPDREAGWIPIALYKGLRIIKGEDIPVLYSSAPPWTAHVIASLLKKRTRIRWVADIRDPWTRRPWLSAEKRRGARYNTLKRIEKAVVHLADRVILNTDPLRRDFSAFYRDINPAKFVTIMNGMDPDDYPSLGNSARRTNDRFVITHGGSFYRKRDPRPFLTAVAELLREKAISESDLVIRFVGAVDPKFNIHDWVRQRDLQGVVTIEPPLAHGRYLELLSCSDLLLLIQPETDLQVPSKLFEYIAVGKPILALAHNGATKSLVEQYKRGHIVDPYDVSAIKKALLDLIDGWPVINEDQVDSDDLGRFSIATLSKELDRVLTESFTQ